MSGYTDRVARVYVCKECDGSPALQRFLARVDGVDVHLVGCQDICDGPVAGVAVEGTLEWFARLDGRKAQAAAAEVASGRRQRLPERLERRRRRKRAGRPPR